MPTFFGSHGTSCAAVVNQELVSWDVSVNENEWFVMSCLLTEINHNASVAGGDMTVNRLVIYSVAMMMECRW